jgi:alpha-tubulin suppressor-like RCC1 family protein
MWGDNTQGQVGINDREISVVDRPTIISTETGQPLLVSKISCGGMHSAAVTVKGDVYCWGKSDSGQTGSSSWYLGLSTNIYAPKKVESLSQAADVTCGGFYTLVLDVHGQVFAMGKEDYGCLGTGAEEPTLDIRKEGPIAVQFATDVCVQQISAGGWHSSFLADNGKLFTCGKGEYGRLGLGDECSKLTPMPVCRTSENQEVNNVVQVSGGGAHTIWFDKNNHVFTVGRLDMGRCGTGTSENGRSLKANDITCKFPFQDFTVLEVSAGGSHSLVLVQSATPLDDQTVINLAGTPSSPSFSNSYKSQFR